jgi:hypothetical protein
MDGKMLNRRNLRWLELCDGGPGVCARAAAHSRAKEELARFLLTQALTDHTRRTNALGEPTEGGTELTDLGAEAEPPLLRLARQQRDLGIEHDLLPRLGGKLLHRGLLSGSS